MSSCPKGLFLSLSRNTSHNQYILLQLITPTLSYLSITHGNLNCHSKVFFQDLSSNSLSFLLKWLLRVRVSHKSRGVIVIQNRWTRNHRWCREGARQSLLLRVEGAGEGGGEIALTLLRGITCFSVLKPESLKVSISVTGLSEIIGFVFLPCTVNSAFLISSGEGQGFRS